MATCNCQLELKSSRTGSRAGIPRTGVPVNWISFLGPGDHDQILATLARVESRGSLHLHDGHRPNFPDHGFYHLFCSQFELQYYPWSSRTVVPKLGKIRMIEYSSSLWTPERIKFPGSPGFFAQSLGWWVLKRLSQNRFFWPVSDWLFFCLV